MPCALLLSCITMKPLIVEGKYQVDFLLGFGGCGAVYQGHDLETSQQVALKLEERAVIYPSLIEDEFDIYKELEGGNGIPRVYWLGCECEFRVMAFELLGPSLEDLFNYCDRKFSLKTVLLLADQIISRFQYIHSKGYIHRDVKPDNMLMGIGKQGNTVYMTDLGMAQEIVARGRSGFVIGTLEYASINAHLANRPSPRDDMEALGYVLLYFLEGSLPWEDVQCRPEEKNDIILEGKRSAEEGSLFNSVPAEFKKYFELVRLDKKLDYGRLRRLFRGLFYRKHFQYDNVFDWTILMFLEEQEAEHETSEPEQDTSETE
ncbi:casein kinase I isoform delta, partial [Phaeosphaeriaceae sp. PMI808]